MKFEIKRGQDPRRPVAKVSRDGCMLYLQGGEGIQKDHHVALGGVYGNKASLNGAMDVTEPDRYNCHQSVYEGDTVEITF